MPIRLTQVGASVYDPAHVRLPPDSVGGLPSFPGWDEMACACRL